MGSSRGGSRDALAPATAHNEKKAMGGCAIAFLVIL